MSQENAQTGTTAAAEASAKKGGTQFIVKMLVLALIVLAIVFYVRSLDHQPTATSTGGPSSETLKPVAKEAPAPAGAETATGDAVPPEAPAQAREAPPTKPPEKAEEPAPTEAPATAGETATAEQATVAPAEPAAGVADVAPVPETPSAEETHFRPLTEEDVLRQVQEVFAPETLEPAPAD